MEINQRKVVITGASRGMGWTFAKAFAERGSELHLVVRKSQSEWTQVLLDKGAQGVHVWESDLSDAQATQKLAQQLEKAQVDILINNAGQLTGGLLDQQDPAQIFSMLQVNLVNLILLTRHLLPGMLERGRGKIVNNASVSGKMYLPCASTYAASKAGVVAFTESLKQELRATGVSTLLLITPGVRTEMFDEIPELYGQNLKMPLKSAITPEQWAEKMMEAIEKDQDILWPDTYERWSLRLSHYTPQIFENLVAQRFTRT